MDDKTPTPTKREKHVKDIHVNIVKEAMELRLTAMVSFVEEI